MTEQEAVEIANQILEEEWATDALEKEEGRICNVDGDCYKKLLDEAATLARFVKERFEK